MRWFNSFSFAIHRSLSLLLNMHGSFIAVASQRWVKLALQPLADSSSKRYTPKSTRVEPWGMMNLHHWKTPSLFFSLRSRATCPYNTMMGPNLTSWLLASTTPKSIAGAALPPFQLPPHPLQHGLYLWLAHESHFPNLPLSLLPKI